MKILLKTLFYLLIATVCFNSSIYATSPKLKMPVTINNISLVKNFDNIFFIEVEFQSNINERASIKLNASDNIELLDFNLIKSKNNLEENITLNKNTTLLKQFKLKQKNENTSLIFIHFDIPKAPYGYKKEVSKYFKIIYENGKYLLFDPRNPGNKTPKEIGKDILIKQVLDTTSSKSNYTVSINGKILIQSRNIGLYGNGVALWFRNTSNPDEWYHPVYSPNPTINTHYDILDEQGNFNFNFTFSGDLSAYNQAIVIVNTANDATYMPAPNDGYIEWGPHGFTAYFNESEGIIASINGSNTNITVNQDGFVNSEDGSVLRYLQLSREFVIQRYGGNLTFNLPHVHSAVENISSAGVFNYGWDPTNGNWCNIRIDPYYTDFSTVSHEYGHFVNYRMWGGTYSIMSDAHPQLKEGWAIFYSFATRNYGNNQYGDYLMGYDDNTEEAPFQENPRYYGIRYTHSGHPDYGAAACFFWSLYDSYVNSNFEVNTYEGDNDDIVGYSARVFEKLKTLGTTHTAAYINHFKNGLNSTTNNSIDDMVSFMFDDYYNIPPHKMHAAQVSNFDFPNCQQEITFEWEGQSYSNSFYTNPEIGYRLYKNISGSWSEITTVLKGTYNYLLGSSNPDGDYKLTSYNSAPGNNGESCDPEYLTVNISDIDLTNNFINGGTGGNLILEGSSVTVPYSVIAKNNVGFSVEAPQQYITISGTNIKYNFYEWHDGNTTNPRSFYPNSNATYTANYKGHLLSDNSEATASNNARRIVKDEEGFLHVVYEDNKKIWYSSSEDNGDTWSDEELVSDYDPDAVYTFPAMAIYDNKLHVVFTMSYDVLPEMKDLLYYTKDLSGGSWTPPSTSFYSCWMDSPLKPSLVVYVKQSVETVMAAFETNIEGEGSVIHLYHKVGNGYWGEKQSFAGKTPSLAVDNSHGLSSQYNEAFLVYEYSGNIFGRRWSWSSNLWGYYHISSWVNFGYQLTPLEASMESYHNPCATLSQLGSNTACYVTWLIHSNVGQESINDRIGFRTYCLEGHFLSEITEFSETNSSQPTISAWQDEQLGVTLFFENSDYVYKKVGTHSYGTFPPEFDWSGQYIGPGRAPNVISNGHSGLYYYDAGAAFTYASTAPYRIRFDYMDPSVEPPPPIEKSKSSHISKIENTGKAIELDSLSMYKRFDYFLPGDSTKSFALGLKNIFIGNKHIRFNQGLLSNSLSFSPMVSNLKFDLSCFFFKNPSISNANRLLFKLQFKNKNGNVYTLKKVKLKDILCYNNGMLNSIPVSIPLTIFANQNGILFFSLDSAITNVVNVVTYPDTVLENISMKPLQDANSIVIPKKFELHPAYPNPFNPMATITYDIPKESSIKLIVYDIQGKIVSVLANSRKDAGRYIAQFNGNNLSTGLYFYEMIATPSSVGIKPYRAVRKMLLVK